VQKCQTRPFVLQLPSGAVRKSPACYLEAPLQKLSLLPRSVNKSFLIYDTSAYFTYFVYAHCKSSACYLKAPLQELSLLPKSPIAKAQPAT
jgi:hypothetical protein